MCYLGTVLWLTLVPAGHLCSLNGVTLQLKSTFVPPATFLLSSVLQVKTQAFQLLYCCLSYFSFSELKSDSKVSALNQKLMPFLDHKSDSFHSGRLLKLWTFWFKSLGIEKLNFSPKGLRTVKI